MYKITWKKFDFMALAALIVAFCTTPHSVKAGTLIVHDSTTQQNSIKVIYARDLTNIGLQNHIMYYMAGANPMRVRQFLHVEGHVPGPGEYPIHSAWISRRITHASLEQSFQTREEFVGHLLLPGALPTPHILHETPTSGLILVQMAAPGQQDWEHDMKEIFQHSPSGETLLWLHERLKTHLKTIGSLK